MKKFKRILAVVLCFAVTIPFVLTAEAVSEQDGFLYSFIDNSDVIEIVGIAPTGGQADNPTVSLPNSLRGVSVIQIGKSAFANNQIIQEILMGENIRQICDEAMYGMTVLHNITLPKFLSVLGKRVFSYCTTLERVNFKTTKLRQIQEFTFYGCTKLNNVILPSSLLELGEYCFGHCASLDKIYIPSSVGKISQTAFYSTKSGLTIYGEKNSEAYRYAVANNIAFVDVSEKDVDGLLQSLSEAERWWKYTDMSLYTDDSVDKLMQAYYSALAVKDDFFSTPEAVSGAKERLDNACHALKRNSMEELDIVVTQAETYLPVFFRYTESSFSALESALKEAKNVQCAQSPSEQEIKSAKKNLNDSIFSLQELTKYDSNNDGSITLADVVMVQKRLISDYSFTPREIYQVDFNNDGIVSLADVILFQRYLLRT